MARSGFVALSFAVLLAIFEIGSCLNCYQCDSESDRKCMDPFTPENNKLVDCNHQAVVDYHRSSLRGIFSSSIPDLTPGSNKYCAKIMLASGSTVRTCLEGNPMKPKETCELFERLASISPNGQKLIKHCSVCETDRCNGAGSISASLPVAVLALIASYLYYKQ